MEKNRKIFIIVFLIIFLGGVIFTIFSAIKKGFHLSDSQPNFEIKSIFDNYLNEKAPQDGKPIRVFSFTDKDNNIIALDKFSTSIGLSIKPELRELLDEKRYSLFSCFIDGKKGYGIALNTNSSLENIDNYSSILEAMKKWEPTMLPDIKSVIFPRVNDINFVSLNPGVTFKDGAFRYAIINMPDGSKKSINYFVTDDSIIIADSKECVYATFPK